MEFKIDHDYHIHTFLSKCSNDPEQTPGRLLGYAEKYNLKEICITDHMWDNKIPGASDWYKSQDFEHISKALPLPKSDKVKFYFGAETEFDKFFRVAISPETMDKLDFIIIPTTHLHMDGLTLERGATFEIRAQLWFDRLAALLQQNLPWHKIGIAHLTTPLLAGDNAEDRKNFVDVLKKVNGDSMRVLFGIIAKRGAGFEINLDPSFVRDEADLEIVLNIYRSAQKEGCKFYLGTDSHHPADLDTGHRNLTEVVRMLGLTEKDKFVIK